VAVVRKPIGLLGALTLIVTLAGALAIPSSVGAAARLGDKFAPSVITAAGNVSCKKVTGNATFSPKLTFLGTPGGDKFQLKVASKKCSGTVTGGGAVINVSGATLTVTGFWNPTNSCTGLTADTLGTLTWKFTWISSPAIAPTTVTTTGGTPWVVSGPVYKFNFPVGGGTITGSGGSFAPVSPLTASFRTAIASPCSTGWGPYPTTTITAGNFTVN
jgi:hypothetical protein